MPEQDIIIGDLDNRISTHKLEETSKIVAPSKSVASNFDDSTFLINKTTGALNKSIGLTREEVIGMLPKMRKFVAQADAT